jgi:hypothetical protein
MEPTYITEAAPPPIVGVTYEVPGERIDFEWRVDLTTRDLAISIIRHFSDPPQATIRDQPRLLYRVPKKLAKDLVKGLLMVSRHYIDRGKGNSCRLTYEGWAIPNIKGSKKDHAKLLQWEPIDNYLEGTGSQLYPRVPVYLPIKQADQVLTTVDDLLHRRDPRTTEAKPIY